jgi:hypothetical protein
MRSLTARHLAAATGAGRARAGATRAVQRRHAPRHDPRMERRPIPRRPPQGARRSAPAHEERLGRRGLGHASRRRLPPPVRTRLEDRQRQGRRAPGRPRRYAVFRPAPARLQQFRQRDGGQRRARRLARSEHLGDRRPRQGRRHGRGPVRQNQGRHHHRRQPRHVHHDQDAGTGLVVDGAVRDVTGIWASRASRSSPATSTPPPSPKPRSPASTCPSASARSPCCPATSSSPTLEGITFVPAHLAEKVADDSELTQLRDRWGHQMLREQKYTPGQIDTQWTPAMIEEFNKWAEAQGSKMRMKPRQ